MTKVVTILGMSQTALRGADTQGLDGEVWGLNSLYRLREVRGARWTRWFDMHALDYLQKHATKRWQWCKALKIPCYLLDSHPEIRCSVAYPLEAVEKYLLQRFQSEPGYLTSSLSYMMGLALYEGFEEIRLYGIDLSDRAEVVFERPGLEYLIGLARGSGVRVVISPDSLLLYTPYLYGYVEPRLRLWDALRFRVDIWWWWRTRRINSRRFKRFCDVMLLTENDIGHPLRLLKGRALWLRTYAKRGYLLRPDGSVN